MSNICNQCLHLSRSVINKPRNFCSVSYALRWDYHVGVIHQKFPRVLRDTTSVQSHSTRSAFSLPNPFRKQQDYRVIDRVPKTYTCVYVSPICLYIAYFYPIATISSALILAAVLKQVLLADPGSAQLAVRGLKAGYTSTFSNSQLMVGSAFTSAMGLSVWRLSARTPLRIYYDEEDETFIATFATNRPWRTKHLQFEPGDVVHRFPSDPDVKTVTLSSFLGEYTLKDRRVGLVAENFIQPYYYNLMLGIFDRGIDKLDD